MMIPSSPADVLIYAVIAVLVVLDWYIGGMVCNRPPVRRDAHEPHIRDEGYKGERKAA